MKSRNLCLGLLLQEKKSSKFVYDRKHFVWCWVQMNKILRKSVLNSCLLTSALKPVVWHRTFVGLEENGYLSEDGNFKGKEDIGFHLFDLITFEISNQFLCIFV